MSSVWNLKHGELHCRVQWRNHQLYWQINHPLAPGGQTQLAPISDLTVHGQPVQWPTLVGVATTHDAHGAPNLTVTLEDSSRRLRLVRRFELFADHAFVRTWGTVERIYVDGNAPPLLDLSLIHIYCGASLRP